MEYQGLQSTKNVCETFGTSPEGGISWYVLEAQISWRPHEKSIITM